MNDDDRNVLAKILSATDDMKGALFSDRVSKAAEILSGYCEQPTPDLKASRDGGKFMLRLGDELRDEIRQAAEANGRSMNSEIIARITGGQANAVRVVTMPTTPDEAEAMEKIGYAWLAANAPERLTDAARERDVVLARYNDLVDRIQAFHAAALKWQ